jgi:hypothetical protein
MTHPQKLVSIGILAIITLLIGFTNRHESP